MCGREPEKSSTVFRAEGELTVYMERKKEGIGDFQAACVCVFAVRKAAERDESTAGCVFLPCI